MPSPRIPRVHQRAADSAANDARWPNTVMVAPKRPPVRRAAPHRHQPVASPAIWRGIAWALSLTVFGIGAALVCYAAVELAVRGLTALLGAFL